MPFEKNDLHRGTLDMLILRVVAAGPLHGYAIAQRLQQISKDYFQVPQGSLYPALHRLEEREWLQAEPAHLVVLLALGRVAEHGPRSEVL